MTDISDHFDKLINEEREREIMESTGIEARRARYKKRLKNKKENECPEGHEYTPENTYYEAGRGRKRCIICVGKSRAYTEQTAKEYKINIITPKPIPNGRQGTPEETLTTRKTK